MMISLRAVWTWVPNNPHTLKIDYEPDVASPDVQRILADGLRYTGPAAKQAEAVANVLVSLLETPQPIDLGSREVEGTYTRIRLLRRSLEPISPGVQFPGEIELIPRVRYGGLGEQTGSGQAWKFDELSPTTQKLLREIDNAVMAAAYAHLYERAGADPFEASTWKPSKTEVFISYRSAWEQRATELFRALGEYEERTIFLPKMDKVDMQSGNWIPQLENMISEAEYFIPLLTADYREGPVARQEMQQALRKSFREGESRKIVPVLIEGSRDDYDDTILGNYHIYDARGTGFTADQINDIAHLLLGVSLNPYA